MSFVAAFCDRNSKHRNVSLHFLIQSSLRKCSNEADLVLRRKTQKLFYMKIRLLWFILSTLLISSAVFAQTSKREYKITTGTESLIDPESRAVKNFKRSHPEAVGETWSIDHGYYFVRFKEQGIKNKIAFTPNGKIDYTMKMYDNDMNLPHAVKAAVKSVYYDYRIVDAQELGLKNTVVYLVKITDSNTWKTIRVSDGDVEEIENYSNAISPCR